MTTVVDIQREVGRLDLDYIANTGWAARAALLSGRPVAVSYTPGNSTAYELVMTPGLNLAHLVGDTVPSGFSNTTDAVVIAILNFERSHPWAVNLLGREGQWLAPWYVSEKLGINDADAIALIALFAEIADNKRVLYGHDGSEEKDGNGGE